MDRERSAGAGDREALLAWLLAGDPSIRWQVLRDLVGAPGRDVDTERQRIAEEGWGARLLAAQDSDGRWSQALYSPKWTSTTYTLLLLHWLGLPSGHPQALAGCRQVWDGARFYDGGLNLARSIREPETCITAVLVLLASAFGHDDDRVDGAVGWGIPRQDLVSDGTGRAEQMGHPARASGARLVGSQRRTV